VKLFFDDEEFDAQFARAVGKTYLGMADVGECFVTAARITPGDYASWAQEWRATAEGVGAIAESAAGKGHLRSAGEAYLRACEYWRSSYFFDRVDLADAGLLDAWCAMRDAFRAGIEALGLDAEVVSIPYEGTELDGYLLRPADGPGPWPTVVTAAGYDSPIEEYFAFNAVGALRRGFAVVMFDGPGQGSALYEKGLVFRPDYEAVFTPVVDWVAGQAGVDPHRLVISGRSFGGYLAPRAASAEHRFRALIADPGLYDLGAAARARMPAELWKQIESADPEADDVFAAMFEKDPRRERWFMLRAVAHGARTVPEYMRMLSEYAVPAGDIVSPTLVTAQPDDQETRRLYDAITAPKVLVEFAADEGAWGHCEGAAPALYDQRTYDWLDEVLPR
jgi:dienelactone hydrolase